MSINALRSSLLVYLLPVSLVASSAILPLSGCGGSGDTGTTGVFTGTPAATGGNGSGNGTGTTSSHGATSGGGTTGQGSTSGTTSGSCPGGGVSCTPANLCDLGTVTCNAAGQPGCTDLGQPNAAQDGVTCNANGGVCDNGTCNTCNEGGACQPTNLCDLGALDCASGEGVCQDTGNANTAANGDSCGNGGTCENGTCVTCIGGATCTPTNICDEGITICLNGVSSCQDQGANPGQNGATCAQGKVCESGACVSQTTGSTGTTGGSSGGTNNWPIVPDQGQPVVATPNLIFLTYSDDPNQAFFNQYGVWIADGGYLPAVAGQYGVGNGTVQFVNLGSSANAPTGTTTNQNAFPDYLQGLLSAGTIPPYAANNLYVLILPSTWSDTTAFCASAGGYHTYFTDEDGNDDLYAIIPNCPMQGGTAASFQFEQVAISHEVVEGTTDPLIESYQIQDMTTPWFYLGGEVGDLCASNGTYYTSANGLYTAQLIWSNDAVSANQVPCQPWSASETYYSFIGPSTMATASPGQTVNVTVTGWANTGGSASIGLYAVEGDYYVDFNPLAGGTYQTTVAVGGTATIALTVPSTATSGEHGAAWIIAYDPTFTTSYGSTMVGVTVQ